MWNLIESKKQRDIGVAQVTANTSDEWTQEADRVVRRFIAAGEPFTSEDVQREMTLTPHHPNAVGGFWFHAIRRYDLQVIGYTRAAKVSSRARILPVWTGKEMNNGTL